MLVVGLVPRVIFAGVLPNPGGSDYAFYYTVAENIVTGKGLTVDFIGNYLSAPQTITHASTDYWMPLASVIISLPMFVAGRNIFVALLPSIFAVLIISTLTYFWGKAYSKSRLVAFSSFYLILCIPPLFHYSTRTDSTIFYLLFAFLSLLFMVRAWDDKRFFLLSAICAGLAHLTRQDGVLLVFVLLTVILLSSMNKNEKPIYALLSLALYLLVLSPLLIYNQRSFGAPLPPGPSKTIFLTQYEDIYSYSKEITLSSYLEWGLSNIFESKLRTLLANMRTLYEYLGQLLSVFVVIGFISVIRNFQNRTTWKKNFPFLAFLAALLVFYSFIATIPGFGGFSRSSLALAPFLLVMAINAIEKSVNSKKIVLIIVVLVGLTFFVQSILSASQSIKTQGQVGKELTALYEILVQDAQKQDQQDIVVMTRNPWMVHYYTKHKTVQIPNEDIDTVYNVAARYGANYLLLPAPREALEPLYTGEINDSRFELVAQVPNSEMKVFRIRSSEVR